MNTRQITSGIVYAGVNDRTTDRFESLWPLPYGVSYNSYVVRDQKTALIDTVELGEANVLFEHLDMILEGKTLDFLIVNHMEPDHSGSIPLLASRYPQMKIVGNRQTISMIGGFYHIVDPDRFVEVADGDSISLGSISLKFFLTPMVHWPETMMTYVPERKVIFTGDALGTFGALNGGVVDYEMETDIYLCEAYRYYSNIVGKYGRFVERAMKKVLPLDIKYVCPTHGPVWHDRLQDIMDIYSRLSQNISEPGTTIVYASMYGNTEAVAEAIAMALAERGERHIRVLNAGKENLSYLISEAFRYDGLIVGAPTYSMTLFPAVDSFMKAMQTREIKGKTLALFGSFTWASAALKEEQRYAEQMKLPVVASLDVKQSLDSDMRREVEKFAKDFVEALRAARSGASQ